MSGFFFFFFFVTALVSVRTTSVAQMQVFAVSITQARKLSPLLKIFTWTAVLMAAVYVLSTIFMVVAFI